MNQHQRNTTSLYLRRGLTVFLWISSMGSLVVLLAAVGYSWRNKSGHMGGDPIIFSMLYGPIFVIGILGFLLTKGHWLSVRGLVSVGFAGLVFGFFVTHLGILNEYGDWIDVGMPDRNPNTPLLLIGFVILGIGGSLVTAYLMPPNIGQTSPHPDSK